MESEKDVNEVYSDGAANVEYGQDAEVNEHTKEIWRGELADVINRRSTDVIIIEDKESEEDEEEKED